MVTPETFLAVAEMVAGHLRLKDADRWSSHVCKLKFHSFTSEFPEVSDTQLMWAAEQWVQALPAGFARYPTWRELMAPLYRKEGGLANRSWGPAEGLPKFVQFKPDQLALLPSQPRSMLPPPDIQNPDAYQVVGGAQPVLPPAAEKAPGLTDEHWQRYLDRLKGMQEEPCT
jgi:hypothetical protein